jgi:hypothetical protein
MGQDLPAARTARAKMMAANPDTGMEVPQSARSIAAAKEFMRSVFGPRQAPAAGRQPKLDLGDMDPKLVAGVLAAWERNPDLVESVNWTGNRIPEKGTRAFLQPPGMFGGRDTINLSPEFENQIDNVWHELSHTRGIGLQDFRENEGDITAHDVTEASRRMNRPRDVNLPREAATLARVQALKDKLR